MRFSPEGSKLAEGECAQYYVQLGRGGRDDTLVWVGKRCELYYNWMCEFNPQCMRFCVCI